MKKRTVALLLTGVMTIMTVVPVWAGEISGDVNWDDNTANEDYTATADCNITIAEDSNVTVGKISGNYYDESAGESRSYNITISGGGTLNASSSTGDAISGKNVSISGTTVNATGSGNGISAYDSAGNMTSGGNVTITDATVTATGTSSNGISGLGQTTITNSTVNATGGSEGILGESGVIITNSDVSASGIVAIQGPVTLSGCSVSEGSITGSSVVIKKEATEEKKTSSEAQESSTSNNTQNDQVVFVTISGVAFTGSFGADAAIKVEEPGVAAQAAFIQSMPQGFVKGFAFSVTNSGQGSYSAKKGTISFKIPAQFVKNGRKFKLMGIDKDGKVKIFDNVSTDGSTFSANIDIEGYSFELVYAD